MRRRHRICRVVVNAWEAGPKSTTHISQSVMLTGVVVGFTSIQITCCRHGTRRLGGREGQLMRRHRGPLGGQSQANSSVRR